MHPGPMPFALDDAARLSPEGARAWREMLRRRAPHEPLVPEDLFGPFAALPAPARAVIRRLVARDAAHRLRWTCLGRWHIGLTRLLWRLHAPSDIPNQPRSRPRQIAGALAYRVWYGPARLAAATQTALARLRFALAPRPRVDSAFAAAGSSAQQLGDDWATDLPVDRRVHGYRRDSDRGNVFGLLLGIDLVPTTAGCVCLEANLNPAMRAERIAVYGTDPIASGIAAFARAHDLTRVVIVGHDFMALNAPLRAQLLAEGARVGIAVTVLDDPRAAAAHDHASRHAPYWLPEVATTRTLVIQIRYFGVGPSRIAHHKLLLQRALADHQRATGDQSYAVAPLRVEPDLAGDEGDPRLPNLVYKYAGLDRGSGVHFLKAESVAHARALARALDQTVGRIDGMFQPFVHPPLLAGDRLYDLRAFALLTPVAAHYLGALRNESSQPVPARLAPGVVADRGPFIMNPYFGNQYTRASGADEAAAAAAVAGIARAVDRSILRTFGAAAPGGTV